MTGMHGEKAQWTQVGEEWRLTMLFISKVVIYGITVERGAVGHMPTRDSTDQGAGKVTAMRLLRGCKV